MGTTPYDEAEFSRRRPVVVREPDVQLVLKSPEDTVLRKLWWFRQGGEVSDRQWRDAVQVIKFGAANIDLAYMDRWAQTLGVNDLLQRAQEQAARGFR